MKQFLPYIKNIAAVLGFAGIVWAASANYNNKMAAFGGKLESFEGTLESFEGTLDDVAYKVESVETSIDSLYLVEQRRDQTEEQIKDMIKTSENRLIYFIKHEGTLTNKQILDAFELGLETGKKKDLTVSQMRY